MGDPVRRNNFWFVVLFVLMIAGGLCIIGYWQTYDLRCGYGKAVWTWNVFPPKFQCPAF